MNTGEFKYTADEAAARMIYTAYKKSARTRGYSFSVDFETFFALIGRKCVYCGAPPSNSRKVPRRPTHVFLYSGLDRINNAEGYVQGNILSCCKRCNYAKRASPAAEFVAWLVKAGEYLAC